LETAEVVWKLADLYAGPNDDKLKEDIKSCEKNAARLNEEYDGKIAQLSPSELLKLTTSLEDLESLLGRISTFAFLNFATRTKNPAASAFLQKIKEFNSRVSRETVFFELEWNQLAEEKAGDLLAANELGHYRHYLAGLRRYAPHQLSRPEETLLLEKAPVGRGSWNNLFDKVMGHLKFGKEQRSEEEVLTDLYSAAREIRAQAARDLTDGLNSQLHILAHIFNTILADKMIDDRLRKYEAWLDAMNLYNELDNSTVVTLIDEVTGRYDIVQRYYELKKDLLGLTELADYDRYAPLPHLPEIKIPWSECRRMVLNSFNDFSPEMAEIAAGFFDKGWIHAPLIDGKRGGAFAHPCVPEVHPYIMVNYSGTLRDVSTVAHELGHGVHQYLAAKQGYYNSSTTLVLAETASVFAELLLFRTQLATLEDEKQKKAFTCQKLESIFATVFRQVAMNRFEELIHNERRAEGELSAEHFSGHWLATQRRMFGDSVTLGDDYGVWWSYIPHFISTPGYVYSYAFGELLVLALYNLYLHDRQGFVPKYLELLSRGGSADPYKLLRPFAIDLNSPEFWRGGLKVIDDMLADIE
ncbi:MAG: M3 family oligoendopeptidase, partial [Desulfurivibrionaceae bacterium]|nr:M3 family oligoendopeptidase [Desulfurivibrionaceae bacterium]